MNNIQDNHYTDMNKAYYDLYLTIRTNGLPYGPRNKSCIEIRPFAFILDNPNHGLYTGESRRLNYRFWAIETLGYIAGHYSEAFSKLICDANTNMKFVLNPYTQQFDGAYGQYISKQLYHVVKKLRKDKYSRQAVISISSPSTMKVFSESVDTPCTCTLQLFTEYLHGRNVLSMCVYMRSNDINWGTPYDVAAFCEIQMLVASVLYIPLGRYTHIAGSFHYYENGNSDGEKPPTILSLNDERWINNDNIKLPTPENDKPYNIGTYVSWAIDILNALYIHRLSIGPLPWNKFEMIDVSPWQQQWIDIIKFKHEPKDNTL